MVSSGLPLERNTEEKKKKRNSIKEANGNFMKQILEYDMPHFRENTCGGIIVLTIYLNIHIQIYSQMPSPVLCQNQ